MASITQAFKVRRTPKAARATGGQPAKRSGDVGKELNSDVAWDEFDPTEYLAHNYEHVRDDDRTILKFVSKFFRSQKICRTAIRSPQFQIRGIDVGTGANLYPALAMLPFCRQITLFEHSASNFKWLNQQNNDKWPSWHGTWDAFWQILSRHRAYRKLITSPPDSRLSTVVKVQPGSVLSLEIPPDDRYDIGTMFFVAESISTSETEFTSAMGHFLDTLRRGAPFAIALMEHSLGYQVGDKKYPATDIGAGHVRSFISEKATDIRMKCVGPGTDPLRLGYTGMIVVCGRVK
jgi:hypothetical protein